MNVKYLIVSDIHGVLSGADAFEKACDLHKPDQIICLGDVLYHGPRNDIPADYAPKQVIEIMNRHANRISAVRGNCDAEVDQMVLQFPLSADYQSFIYKRHTLFVSHGHIYGPERLPLLKENDIFLSGHTHVPTAYKKEGIYLLNPGSVSMPKENHPASYGLLDDHGFTVFTCTHEEYMHIDIE